MNLDPRKIALQGIGFAALAVALQGFVTVPDAVVARSPAMNVYRAGPEDFEQSTPANFSDDEMILIAAGIILSGVLQ